MEIKQTLNNDELIVTLKGEINSSTAPELEEALKDSLDNIKRLVFDFTELSYISSAGLRVLLVAKKTIDKNDGQMVVRNPNDSIMDVFEITGFKNILDFE